MSDVLSPKQLSAIERAKGSPALRQLLFSKVTGTKWFSAFEAAGFLVAQEIPAPIPAKQEGYVSIPVWGIVDYLVATSPEFLKPENEKYAKQVMEFIRNATSYARANAFGNYRVWWKFAQILQNIPSDLVRMADIKLADYWLNDRFERGLVAQALGEKWLPALLDRGEKHSDSLAVALLKTLFVITKGETKYETWKQPKVGLRYDNWHAQEIVKKIAGVAGEKLQLQATNIFRNTLRTALTYLKSDRWSTVWRPAIEEHDQNHRGEETEAILVEAFRDALMAYVGQCPEAAVSYVTDLLHDPLITIRRIAIFVVQENIARLSSVIDEILSEENFSDTTRHEVWNFLRKGYPTFSEVQKRKTQSIILALKITDESGSNIPNATAYRQAIWLAALKDHSKAAQRRYLQSVAVAGSEPSHPEFSSYSTSGWVDHATAPITEEIISLSISEVVQRLREADDLSPRDLEGLAKALRHAVEKKAVAFSEELELFQHLNVAFVYEVIEAYTELWSTKASLPWDRIWSLLLKFCEGVVLSERFWIEDTPKGRPPLVGTNQWVVGAIGRLIELGTKSDEYAFPEGLLPQAESILKLILAREGGAKFTPDCDAVMKAINSSRGRCIEALVNLALRTCRIAQKRDGRHSDAWLRLQPIFDQLIQPKTEDYEVATLVALYLANFLYMSNEWTLANLGTIFDQSDYQRWLCAMQGYIYVNTVYKPIYEHLREDGSFVKGLDDPNIGKKVCDKIVQNIAVAYFSGFEGIDDEGSLLKTLLARRKYEELSQLIWFVWTFRGTTDRSIQPKVIKLWQRLLDSLDMNATNDKKLAARLIDWLVFVDEVDDSNKHLIFPLLAFADSDHHSFGLLENIARIGKKQPAAAYEIWRRVVDVSFPEYPPDALRAALENIAADGQEGILRAKAIASKYFENGSEGPSKILHELKATHLDSPS